MTFLNFLISPPWGPPVCKLPSCKVILIPSLWEVRARRRLIRAGGGGWGNPPPRDPQGVRAWAPDDATADAIVLRCGLPRPIGFDVASALQVINGVQWFEVSGADSGIDASTWYTVDRPVYVALTVPGGSGPTPLQDASDAISASLPQTPLDPAPLQ